LLEDGARIVQIIHKQPGIYGMLRANQVNMRKSMQPKLEKGRICMTSILPGIYQKEQYEAIQATLEHPG